MDHGIMDGFQTVKQYQLTKFHELYAWNIGRLHFAASEVRIKPAKHEGDRILVKGKFQRAYFSSPTLRPNFWWVFRTLPQRSCLMANFWIRWKKTMSYHELHVSTKTWKTTQLSNNTPWWLQKYPRHSSHSQLLKANSQRILVQII